MRLTEHREQLHNAYSGSSKAVTATVLYRIGWILVDILAELRGGTDEQD